MGNGSVYEVVIFIQNIEVGSSSFLVKDFRIKLYMMVAMKPNCSH